MNPISNKLALSLLALLPAAAQAHPGHPDSDHFIGGFILLVAGVYVLKRSAAFVARTVRIRKP